MMPKKTTYIILMILLTLSMLSAAGAEDRSAITSIDVMDNAVQIKASGPFTYTVYKPSDPYTVVVELPDVAKGSALPRIVSDKKGISEIKVIESPGSPLKIEMLLESPLDVEPSYGSNSLLLKVKEALAQQDKKPLLIDTGMKIASEETTQGQAKEIKDAKFEYSNGVLKLVLKTDGKIIPTVFSLEKKIVIDVPGVSITAKIPEPMVSPVKGMRYGAHKDKVRIVIDLKEEAEFTVEALASAINVAFRVKEMPVEMTAIKTEEGAAAGGMEEVMPPSDSKYMGKFISLDFQDSAIVPIIRLLGDIGGFNTVIHPEVKGGITLKLSNVPWDQALDIVLETTGYEKSVEGNIMRVAPTGFFQKLKDDAEKRREAGVRVEPLVEELIPLNYAEAEDLKKLIETKKILSPRGSIDVHPGENTLIVRDTEASIITIKEFISKVNTPVPQVMIEAKIVEVKDEYTEELGIRWFTQSAGTMNVGPVSGDFNINTPLKGTGESTTGGKHGGGGIGSVVFGTTSAVKVSLSLEALERIGKTKKLANPKVLTMNKEQAKIQQGASIPVQTTSAEGSKTEFVDANLYLHVTPTIKGDFVQLEIKTGNDSPITGGGINKQSVETKALVKNGETLVVGGIYTSSEGKVEGGIPWLSKIPILGWLFKTRYKEEERRELLIFITPTIVTQPSL